MEPKEYIVEQNFGNGDIYKTYTTYGTWSIEGDFLITWTKDGLRMADRIGPNVMTITTTDSEAKFPALRSAAPPEGLAADYAASAE